MEDEPLKYNCVLRSPLSVTCTIFSIHDKAIWYIILSPPSKDRVEWGQRCPLPHCQPKSPSQKNPQLWLASTLWGLSVLSSTVDCRTTICCDITNHLWNRPGRFLNYESSKPSPQMCGVQPTGSESCSHHSCLCHQKVPAFSYKGCLKATWSSDRDERKRRV